MAAVFDSLNDPKLAELLSSGKIGIIPTDTVYGLVCQASNPKSVKHLYALKKRDKKPGTIIAASIDQLTDLGIKRRYLVAVEQFWPGPISVVVPSTDKSTQYLRRSVPSIAVRIPDKKYSTKWLNDVGALLTSSANKPGEKIANTIEEAALYFGDTVDFYVDGGNLSARKPSTIIRMIDDEIEVLREGAVKIVNNKVVKK